MIVPKDWKCPTLTPQTYLCPNPPPSPKNKIKNQNTRNSTNPQKGISWSKKYSKSRICFFISWMITFPQKCKVIFKKKRFVRAGLHKFTYCSLSYSSKKVKSIPFRQWEYNFTRKSKTQELEILTSFKVFNQIEANINLTITFRRWHNVRKSIAEAGEDEDETEDDPAVASVLFQSKHPFDPTPSPLEESGDKSPKPESRAWEREDTSLGPSLKKPRLFGVR